MKELILALALLCSVGNGVSQLVCVGAPRQCEEEQKRICAEERDTANLVIAGPKTMHGQVSDATGEAFGPGFELQIRALHSGQVFRSARLDTSGQFEFAGMHDGKYRLIVVRVVSGMQKRTGFDQPVNLRCDGPDVCRLRIVLRASPTDQAINQCPPE